MAGQTKNYKGTRQDRQKTMKGPDRIDKKLRRDQTGQTKDYEGTWQDRQKTMKGHGRIDKRL